MKIAVIDDYQDAFRQCACSARLAGHEVTVYRDTEKDALRLAARLADADAVVLTQQRSAFPRAVMVSITGSRSILSSVAFAAASDSVSPPMVKEKNTSSISFIRSARPHTAESG